MHGLLIATSGLVQSVVLSQSSPIEDVAALLGVNSVYPKLLGSLVFWLDTGAALEHPPRFNIPAMWAVQEVRGPYNLPVLWGDVVVTGRAAMPGEARVPAPADLATTHLALLHRTLTGQVQ